MTCDRHEEMVEKLSHHDEAILNLQIADAETKTEIRNLIEQMSKLVATMERFMGYAWKVLLTVAGFGMGFIIWYIQSK